MTELVTVPATRPALVAGHRPTAIVPTSMEEAFRLAQAVCVAGMAPKGMDRPESCMVAIMHGLEVGLTPMAALQRIAIVNGRPTIWGDGAIGLVRASGLCEYVKETLRGEGDAMVATCETKRRGETEPAVRTFSVADAKKAGLWGKAGPWQQYPTRMLAMRARAFALRDTFADVLGGLYVREELEDEQLGGEPEARAHAPRREPPPRPALPQPETRPEPVVIEQEAKVSEPAPVVAEPRRSPPPRPGRNPTPYAGEPPAKPQGVASRFEAETNASVDFPGDRRLQPEEGWLDEKRSEVHAVAAEGERALDRWFHGHDPAEQQLLRPYVEKARDYAREMDRRPAYDEDFR